MSISAEIQRTTLIITPGQLLSGSLRVPYRDGDDESLLRSYLVFVREMRGQRHARSVTLRSADIATIADHLDTSDDVVLGRLLDLMGVTRAQRKLLLAMLAAGALTIVATGSIPGAAITDVGTADTTGTDRATRTRGGGSHCGARGSGRGRRGESRSGSTDGGRRDHHRA